MKNNFIKKVAKKLLAAISLAAYKLLSFIPLIKALYETRETQTPVKLSNWIVQKVFGINRKAYWPVHFTSLVTSPHRIKIGIETSPGLMPGCYIQGVGGIEIGDYTQIASNVGIISANHDLHDSRVHSDKGAVHIGRYCWLGMNSVILPGVIIGDYTIVGAGAVVTRSFPEGFCVVAGNPAKVIKKIDSSRCVFHNSSYRYHGYICSDNFEEFSKKLDLKCSES